MKSKFVNILLFALPLLVALISISVGRYHVDFDVQMKILLSQVFPIEQTWTQMEETVVMNVRLPGLALVRLSGFYCSEQALQCRCLHSLWGCSQSALPF